MFQAFLKKHRRFLAAGVLLTVTVLAVTFLRLLAAIFGGEGRSVVELLFLGGVAWTFYLGLLWAQYLVIDRLTMKMVRWIGLLAIGVVIPLRVCLLEQEPINAVANTLAIVTAYVCLSHIMKGGEK